jgi:DNA-binding NtrC family response regulator
MEKVALIVEDELFIVLELEELLTEAGYNVGFSHSTVGSALLWLERNIADLAIIDYRLRDTTSEALVARLVEAKIPTIIYSGNDYSEDFHDRKMKQFEWVSKPSSPDVILAAIQRATQSSQS